MLKHKKTLIISSTLVGIISLGALPQFLSQVITYETTGDTTLIATKPISHKQSTGGTSLPNPDQDPSVNPSTSEPTASLPPSKQAIPDQSQVDNAPKQTETKGMVAKESIYRAFLLPNDPYAQSSTVFANTHASNAWDLSTGQTVIVADIDTGFALSHEDLQDAWYTNNGEQGLTKSGDPCWTGTAQNKASNTCDDDQNGYVDDWRGWNFIEVDNNPQAGRQDPNGQAVSHGTETAGLIGAVSNNAIGTASLNWHTKIMPLQALSDFGSGYTSDIISAIYYAVDNGASIINMSLGGYEDDPYLVTAIQYAYDHDVIVVAAAGNCGTGTEFGCDPTKPGAIAHPALDPHVIAVGAVNDSNQRASFSSYGPALDVVAPGSGSIISPMWLPSNQTSAYSANLYGTSFAAPIVSSLASLLRSERPSSSVDDITALIDGSAQKITGLAGRSYSTTYGHGLINSESALIVAQALQQLSAVPTLGQTGSEISEHSYGSSSLLNSGCEITPDVYCTVWAQNTQGYDRYLPYQLSSQNAGWQWHGSVLGSGEWRLRARSGDNISAQTYFMFAK